MKKLILFLLVFAPVLLLAQNKVEGNDDQEKVWMNKISSDSEMRNRMIDMIIEKTKGNKDEMIKLANSFTANPEMYKIIMDAMPKKAGGEYSLQSGGKMHESRDSIEVMRMKSIPIK